MKYTYLLVVTILLIQSPIHLYSQTSFGGKMPTKSKADLINDIRFDSDGGYKADNALKLAVQTQQVDVVTVGLTVRSYNTRGACVNSLKFFPIIQQKTALATALADKTAWNEEHIGENRAAQETIDRDIVEILTVFGINATWKDLINPAARKSIVDQLVGSH